MDIQKAVKMYNEEGKRLEDIAKELNVGKSTVSKALKNNGYILNKAIKQYIQGSVEQYTQETINTGNNKTINTVPRETINTAKCTFDLPIDLATALKVKSSVERVKMVKIVEKALRNVVESKYFIK
jgi:IS30 family transposase